MLHLTLSLSVAILIPNLIDAQRVVPYGSGVSGGTGVNDLAVYGDQLIIAGRFTEFNSHVRRNIQGWDGTQHFDMPGAFEDPSDVVLAMEVYQGDLIVAGNDADVQHIARWNGVQWSSIGTGLTERVRALAVFEDNLIAAGNDQRVVRWNGSTWEMIGEAFNGAISALAVYNGMLFVGGEFDSSLDGEQTFGGLALWNGVFWEPVQTGFNGNVVALLSTTVGLVVCGAFTSNGAGTLTFPGWTVFNGANFSEEPHVLELGGITGLCSDEQGGFLVCGESALHVSSGPRSVVYFDQARASAIFMGRILLAGQGGNSLSYRRLLRVGELLRGRDLEVLDVGGVAATITPLPRAFNTDAWSASRAGFEVPRGSRVHALFSVSPWLVGHVGDDVHASVRQYTNDSLRPWAGPFGDVMDDWYKRRYHQVWKLDRMQVEAHIAGWNSPEYVTPYAIASWPGNGDLSNGEPFQLAPFKDMDNDGLYEPEQGDHPLIRGDMAVYSIQHTEPDATVGALPMQVDIHTMHYAYTAEADVALRNTIFTNYRFVNRSSAVYSNVRFGPFTEQGLGCPNDDFVGCDSTRNLFFSYNWDDFDDDCSGALGYGTQPPSEGVKFLNAEMSAHSSYRASPVIPEMETVLDAMNGTRFGLPFTTLGYPSHFEYSGGDFVETIQASIGRSSIGTSGPFTFGPGDTLCFDLAFIYARAESGYAYASVAALKFRADSVQAFYDSQWFNCGADPNLFSSVRSRANAEVVRLYPNPTIDRFMIGRPLDGAAASYSIRNVAGALVRQGVLPAGESRTTIALFNVEPGVYLVEVRSVVGVNVQRLVVQ